ncbi:MAG: ATPase, T2SS/T4P/T4SS family [Elusimicrobiota bacterium]
MDWIKPKLAQILLLERKITSEQLQEALLVQKEKKKRIGDVLLDLGYVNEEDIAKAYAKQMNMEFIRLDNIGDLPEEATKTVPFDYAFRNKIIVLNKEGNTLTIVTTKPNDTVVEDLKIMTRCYNITQKITVESDMKSYYDNYTKESFQEFMDNITVAADESTGEEQKIEVVEESNLERVMAEDTAPAIRLVNEFLNRAVDKGVSDVHIEPYEKGVFLRYRIHGVLYDQPQLPKKLQNAITSRIKIMSKLDISERRMPQDGRIRIKLGNKQVDLRISIIPTAYGEKICIRILDPSSLCVDLNKLGIEPRFLDIFRERINDPYGMVLVTGPTGSGKTTTLYSALTALNKRDSNIVTAEDPVEFMLTGINQVQVNNDIGLTFAHVLRSFMRQDPDIIMVGEIRDTETAEIAINSALTGHLVLSTLHTNDAIGVVTRLVNMDIEPYLIASTLTLSVAQRLIRRLCTECRQKDEWDKTKLLEFGIDKELLSNQPDKISLYKAHGCQKCRETGYTGRLGCFELLNVTHQIKEYILQRRSSSEIKELALKTNNFISLRKDASRKLLEGLTSVEEVISNTTKDDETL